MASSSDVSFFVGDSAGGNMIVSMTLPTGAVIQGPLQILRVTGPGIVTPPRSPMPRQEFTAWRLSLEESGFAVELRFAD